MKKKDTILNKNYGDWALVTGASSGIGKAFASLLSKEGINTVCVSDEKENQEAVCEKLAKDYNVESIPCVIDLSNENFIDTILETIGNRKISMLICCASFGFVGRFQDKPVDFYTKLIHVSVYSYFRLVYEFYPKMLKENRGAIILVSSINISSPLGLSVVYTSSKAFEYYFGLGLSWELKNSDIDTLVVLPGPTKTNFQAKAGTTVASFAMEPEKVAEKSLKALGKKNLIKFGWRSKLFYFLAPFIPIKKRVGISTKVYSGILKDELP